MAHLHIHGSPKDAFLLVWLHATQPGPAARLLIDQTGSFHSKKRGPGPFNHQLYQSRGEVRKLGGGSDATSCVATPALASPFVTSVDLYTKENTRRKLPAGSFFWHLSTDINIKHLIC